MAQQKISSRINALSIDLEDWYHPELIRRHVDSFSRDLIQHSTELLLKLLNKYNTKATFFVLGEIAMKHPGLIKRIYKEGHEIATHGFSHRTLQEIGPSGLRDELRRFLIVMADILGNIEIKGIRLPSFSLTDDTKWAVEIIKEYGFKYDSSVFPIKINNFYGVKGAPLDIYGLGSKDLRIPDDNSTLKEFPITIFEISGIRFPVSGGFYLRLLPLYIQVKLLRLINKSRPFILYIHPWECCSDTPKIPLNIIANFISYYNMESALIKLECLLNNFKFDRIDNILGV